MGPLGLEGKQGGVFMKETAILVAGIIFLLVSVMHLWRIVFKVEVKVKDSVVPLWLSVFGFFFALGLAVWMLRLL
jgi:hypothetical protein